LIRTRDEDRFDPKGKTQTRKIFMNKTADELQFGGTHYKEMAVQPWVVMQSILTHEEFVGFLKGSIIKYAMRNGRKDEFDEDKLRHYLHKLEEVQESYP